MDQQNWDLNAPGRSLFIYKTGLCSIRPCLPYWEGGRTECEDRTGTILPGDGECVGGVGVGVPGCGWGSAL